MFGSNNAVAQTTFLKPSISLEEGVAPRAGRQELGGRIPRHGQTETRIVIPLITGANVADAAGKMKGDFPSNFSHPGPPQRFLFSGAPGVVKNPCLSL
ncbi:MAG: hypothetical protein LBI87_06330 [Candidatus Accumulibacter sp.]|nr:hypothetical protein [Accumulibacter sp.]